MLKNHEHVYFIRRIENCRHTHKYLHIPVRWFGGLSFSGCHNNKKTFAELNTRRLRWLSSHTKHTLILLSFRFDAESLNLLSSTATNAFVGQEVETNPPQTHGEKRIPCAIVTFLNANFVVIWAKLQYCPRSRVERYPVSRPEWWSVVKKPRRLRWMDDGEAEPQKRPFYSPGR